MTSGKEGRGRDWGAGVKGREFLSHRCARFVMIRAFAFHARFCVYVKPKVIKKEVYFKN